MATKQTKQTTPTTGKGLRASKAAAKAPVTLAPVQPAVQAPAAPAQVVIPLRGGLAYAYLQLTPTCKPYRTACPHNTQWWGQLHAAVQAAPGHKLPLAQVLLTQANPTGVPGHFIGYAVRRGYMVGAQA